MGTNLAEANDINICLSNEELIQTALENQEGVLADNGALSVNTGKRTGRSPKDRFIVQNEMTRNTVSWGAINQPISQEKFTALWQHVEDYLRDKKTYSDHLAVGADKEYQIPVNVTTEFAWHLLFCQNLFINHVAATKQIAWTLVNAANFKTDPERDGVNSDAAVLINFSERKVLVCGTHYAGEMKKAMFSVLNYVLTDKNVLPMHCSANVGEAGDTTLFFGLSGTGKTTLSADPKRYLIGDDEHGWSDDGIFNFEGGCYAKCIHLSKKNEPVIWNAIREGAVIENVVLDENGIPDYARDSLTQNTRAAYPLEHIEKRVFENTGGQPKAVVFLTCDLYGVLPPVAKLTREQAAYYFLSGYTALVGSTEVGHNSTIKPIFSTCFGAPFFPRPANVYASLLLEKLDSTQAPVYLVNTGWFGGAYEKGGQRFSIPTTRTIIDAIVNGCIKECDYAALPYFNFAIPTALRSVESQLLDPRASWRDQSEYEQNVKQLVFSFQENFKQYVIDESIRLAGPKL